MLCGTNKLARSISVMKTGVPKNCIFCFSRKGYGETSIASKNMTEEMSTVMTRLMSEDDSGVFTFSEPQETDLTDKPPRKYLEFVPVNKGCPQISINKGVFSKMTVETLYNIVLYNPVSMEVFIKNKPVIARRKNIEW